MPCSVCTSAAPRAVVGGPDPNGLTVLFVVRVNGTGLRQVSPSGVRVDLENGVASWSPSGDRIVFGGNVDPDHRRSIFVVNTDGSGFHQVPIPSCGGAFSDRQSIACFEPAWSPDGTKIIFARSSVMFGTTAIYTASPDGSGLTQVTNPTHLGVGSPDWGTHPAG
jgi:TolB protein